MLGLSDRDSKIILFLLIIAVIALPYVLYTKGLREETEIIKGDNITLQARLEELQEMNKNRDFYIAETERMKKERDELIASFPAEIDQENTTMFLHYLEYNSMIKAIEQMTAYAEDEEDEMPRFGYDGIDGNTTVLVSSVGYGKSDYIAISDENAEDGLSGVINDTNITMACYPEGMKYMLQYILDYADPMIYRKLSMKFQESNGQVDIEMMLEQYAIAGQGRTLDPVAPWPDLDEEELRGILEYGIFGPIKDTNLYKRQMFEVYLEELAKEEEEEEEGTEDILPND
jgi:hypothetical protein